MSDGLPDEAGEYARQGTACHMMLHDLLEGAATKTCYDVDGRSVPVTGEMFGWVQEVFNWVCDYTRHHLGATVQSELTLHIYGDDCWGTADIVISTPDELVVADAKFGTNEVEVHDNLQLQSYLVGALRARAQSSRHPAPRRMRVAILQPRCGEPKEEVVDGATLREFEARLLVAVEATEDPAAPLHASPEACQYCPAAAVCPENQKMTLAIAQSEFSIVPERLTPAQVAQILAKAKAIKRAVAAVEDHAKNELRLGRYIPGFKRVRAKAHRRWPPDSAKRLTAVLPLISEIELDIYPEPELKSPAQLEKELHLPPGTLDPLTEKPEGGDVVVPESDPRPALKPEFDDVPPEAKE